MKKSLILNSKFFILNSLLLYPVVILPLYLQHYVMLSRNLFYTGLTRAKKLAIVIGGQKPISIAVNQVKENLRYTRLKERLVTFSMNHRESNSPLD